MSRKGKTCIESTLFKPRNPVLLKNEWINAPAW